MLSRIDRYFEETICVICLIGVSCCVMLQVILRFVFSAAAVWAEEVAVYSLIAAVYFGASLAVRERGHIRITVLIDLMPRAMAVASVLLADLLWFGFLIFLFWQSTLYTHLLFEVTYITPGLGIEQKWVQLIVPCALALMTFRMLQVYWRWRQTGWKGLPL